jgi:UDP-glucose 4-epimerase
MSEFDRQNLSVSHHDGIKQLAGEHVLITGGTGSLGKEIVDTLLGLPGYLAPASITVFSRDEAKQCLMEEAGYARKIRFLLGDIRRKEDVARALQGIDIVFNAAALKQVPRCESEPYSAVLTNIVGPQNIVDAVLLYGQEVKTVVCISTDKACKPVNVMGMTKAIQERIFINAAQRSKYTKFVCVRYGNVLTSRGSVIPFFLECLRQDREIPITTRDMNRFLLTLQAATHTAFSALVAAPGEIIVPQVKAARIIDIARVLAQGREPNIRYTGIRPGEKVSEVLISEEEIKRTYERGEYYSIRPLWAPDCPVEGIEESVGWKSYSSQDHLMEVEELRGFLIDSEVLNGN